MFQFCNTNGNCHCNEGWAPPLCNTTGNGGSVDSGHVTFAHLPREQKELAERLERELEARRREEEIERKRKLEESVVEDQTGKATRVVPLET